MSRVVGPSMPNPVGYASDVAHHLQSFALQQRPHVVQRYVHESASTQSQQTVSGYGKSWRQMVVVLVLVIVAVSCSDGSKTSTCSSRLRAAEVAVCKGMKAFKQLV